MANGTIGSIGVSRIGAFLEANTVECAKGCKVASLPEGTTRGDSNGASGAATTGSIRGGSKFDARGEVIGSPAKFGATNGALPGATAGDNTGAEGSETGDVVATEGEAARSDCFAGGRVVSALVRPNDPSLSERTTLAVERVTAIDGKGAAVGRMEPIVGRDVAGI